YYTRDIVSIDGVPRRSVIKSNWWTTFLPGNKGFPVNTSANMHPMLQMSIAADLGEEGSTELWSSVPSCRNIILQGIEELTCCIRTVQKTVVGVSLNATRASPKSHIFNLQLEFAKIFLGLRSRMNVFEGPEQLIEKELSFLEGGSIMCLISTISGCLRSLRSLISRRILAASETCSKILCIFLIATLCLVCRSMAEHTTP
ncbi:hypothetical protein U9M48_044987, partial [Paspalum notatum var. saurae]